MDEFVEKVDSYQSFVLYFIKMIACIPCSTRPFSFSQNGVFANVQKIRNGERTARKVRTLVRVVKQMLQQR